MRKEGFIEVVIDLIWRLVEYNCYANIINVKSHGFFHSTQRIKQGDPLSRALFILTATVLSRALNTLFEDGRYKKYGLSKRARK